MEVIGAMVVVLLAALIVAGINSVYGGSAVYGLNNASSRTVA
jgi:hypothetical protein